MFCEGTSLDATGRIIATGRCKVCAYLGLMLTMAGGNDAAKTSIYDPLTDTWTAEGEMNLPRGYQSVSDGFQVPSFPISVRKTCRRSKALKEPISFVGSGSRAGKC